MQKRVGLEKEEREEQGVPVWSNLKEWFLAGEEGRRPRAC